MSERHSLVMLANDAVEFAGKPSISNRRRVGAAFASDIIASGPENRARYLLDAYFRDVARAETVTQQDRDVLQKLIADALRKAVTDDRVAVRDKMSCHSQEPCSFEIVCSHHKALAAAFLDNRQESSAT